MSNAWWFTLGELWGIVLGIGLGYTFGMKKNLVEARRIVANNLWIRVTANVVTADELLEDFMQHGPVGIGNDTRMKLARQHVLAAMNELKETVKPAVPWERS